MQVNGIVTEVGVNMGDRYTDVDTAVEIDPDMTVRELVEMTLGDWRWNFNADEQKWRGDPAKHITLRVAMPIKGGK